MSDQEKTILITYMCDHVYVLQAAMEYFGLKAKVLPPSTDASTAVGQSLVLGRECSPCMIVAGDLISYARRSDFEPARTAILIPTAPGPCRFGQYAVLQRHLLDEHGLQAVEIISPTSENSYQGFGERPRRLRMLAWDGAVALDLLQQLLHRFRPYAAEEGAADRIYAAGLARIVEAVRSGGRDLPAALIGSAARFDAIPRTGEPDRPLIGVVGEIYVRFNRFVNQEIIRRVEALGGEVLLASMMEWLYLTTWNPGYYARRNGDYLTYVIMRLTELYQRHREHRLTRAVAHLLRDPYEMPVGRLKQSVQPYLEPMVETEAVLTIGRAIEMARHGASGILAVMPFSCMPGIVSAAISPRLRADLDDIPWLDLSFDLQKSTNIQTRLEAFMYQAKHYQCHQLGR